MQDDSDGTDSFSKCRELQQKIMVMFIEEIYVMRYAEYKLTRSSMFNSTLMKGTA